MSHHNAMQTATKLASTVYKQFMKEVVDKHVLLDRRGQPALNAKQQKAIKNGKLSDIRPLYLMSISGKGGWTDNIKQQKKYLKNSNITLLDHLLSVTRGALMLASLDWLLFNENMKQTWAMERLKVIAVIAFLHDLDKMAQLKRGDDLTLRLVRQTTERYGINDFLGDKLHLSAEQIRFLIEHAEDTQAHRSPPIQLPPREYETDIKKYVNLSDKLDGIWQHHGANNGLQQIIDRLATAPLSSEVLKHWQAIEIFDPHHPFLLDELQRNLSGLCVRLTHIPPLLEIQQDGYLFVLLPAEFAEKIKQRALQRLCQYLPFNLELSIPTAGVPELINDNPTYQEYKDFISSDNIDSRLFGRIFVIKTRLIPFITLPLDELLSLYKLAPEWLAGAGQTKTPYPDPDKLLPRPLKILQQAACLALALNLKIVKGKVPNYSARQQQLLQLVELDEPTWLTEITAPYEQQSRRTLTALWATALAQQDDELTVKIWGEDGLIKQWLDIFSPFFVAEGKKIIHNVERYFGQLLQKKRVVVRNEKATGRCLFTDEPTSTTMAGKMKLYEVKVSAFTGRAGKPDSIVAPAKGIVPIGNVSIVEHKLRTTQFKQQGGKPSGTPNLISSPITTGLFAALILNNEKQFQAQSVYDLARKKVLKGKINYNGLDMYRFRYQMARFERFPETLAKQMNLLRLMLIACSRIGRPIHVFKGLPTFQKAFFYYDAMPDTLRQIIGFHELRLEQIPTAIKDLEMAQQLIDEPGLGYDVMRLYAIPKIRFRALCLSYCHLKDKDKPPIFLLNTLFNRLQPYFNLSKEKIIMSQSDGALVQLGQKATRIQQNPGGRASTSDELLVFKITLDTVLGLRFMEQTDKQSLIYGIAGELEKNLVRKKKACKATCRDEIILLQECINFATFFVKSVWQEILKQRPPSHTNRRLLASVYRVAFIQASKNKTKQQ